MPVIDIDRFKLEKARQELEQLDVLLAQLEREDHKRKHAHKEFKNIMVTTDHSAPPKAKLRNPVLQASETLKKAESKMAKIYKATDSNVEIQERTADYGRSWQYRLYCSRCKSQELIPEPKKFLEEVPTDETIMFCIKHRHDAKPNALRVLQVFADKQDETQEMPERMFREDDE